MPFSFEEAYKEALASAPADVTIIETITIDHPTFPSPFRFARTDKDVTLDGDVFSGSQFEVTLPQMSAGSSASLQISVSDIKLNVGKELDVAAESLVPITVLYQSFLTTETSAQAEFSAPLEGTQLSLQDRTLVMSATYPDLVNKKIPAIEYSTNLMPGLR